MNITFGERIKNLREDAELNDIIAFCKYFGVTADYLLGLSNNK